MKINIPILNEYDIVVTGGTTKACMFAAEMARRGKCVLVATSFSYLGEDVCGTLDFSGMPQNKAFRPAELKYLMDKQLLDAGVDFLYQLHPVALGMDQNDRVAGVLFAGKGGFFCVQSRLVADFSIRNLLMRQTRPEFFRKFRPGKYRVTLNTAGPANGEKTSWTLAEKDTNYPVFSVVREIFMSSNSPVEMARTDARLRQEAWCGETFLLADLCRFELDDGLCENYTPTLEYPVLSTACALPETAMTMLKELHPGEPSSFFRVGEKQSRNLCISRPAGFRSTGHHEVEWKDPLFNRMEKYDVAIAGGGTGGAPATIAAAENGAKTICIEMLNQLGGLPVAGRISGYWFGCRVGFTALMDHSLAALSDDPTENPLAGCTPRMLRSAWLLAQTLEKGATILLNHTVSGVFRSRDKVTGLLLSGPFGTFGIDCRCVVDATGNADISAAAGAETVLFENEPAVQGAAVCGYSLKKNNMNSDYCFCCDSDVYDVTKAFIAAHIRFRSEFDVSRQLASRERRRIVGDLTLLPEHIIAGTIWDDTIALTMSDFDTHGFITHPFFMIRNATHDTCYAAIPYRIMLTAGLANVITTGLGMSAHRDSMPLIRMQPDVQNQGYSAGLAAAMTSKRNSGFREVDFEEFRKRLIEKQILPPSPARFIQPSNDPLVQLFLNRKSELPSWKKKCNAGDQEAAFVLCMFGEKSASAQLAREIAGAYWDFGWNYRGMGQNGASMSPLDSKIIALGKVNGIPEPVLEKLAQLHISDAFSHLRAVSLFFIGNPDGRAAGEFERLLREPGATGYSVERPSCAAKLLRAEYNDNTFRNSQLKEVYLARALAACNPQSTLAGEILNHYASGADAYFAYFATSVKRDEWR